MIVMRIGMAGVIVAAIAASAAEFPQAEISASGVRARLYLPDAEKGYYRATRFDWAGVIPSLEWKGHSYFGQWFERYDPKLHDAIDGPVESFRAIGYDEAEPGGTFLRIGVGLLRKPDAQKLNDFKTYDIADGGKWTVTPHPDSVEFVHELPGWYVYRKVVRLASDKPRLVIEHHLQNTGSKLIDTDVYNHDFFMLDGQPSGPDVTVQFPFDARAAADLKGLVEVREKNLLYLKQFEKGQSIYSLIEGFAATPADYDIRVENRKSGAGVRQTSDRPMSKLAFWSIVTTVCPEAYTAVRVEPGRDFAWTVAWDFYEVGRNSAIQRPDR
ncbi:MAG TPA: hypothetical protein VGF59_02275 [Bryobacteraceae bacterium]|jgi:hypothetical protein